MEKGREDIKLTIRAKDQNHIYELQHRLKKIYGDAISFEGVILLTPPNNRFFSFITFWHITFLQGGSRRDR